MKNKGFITLLWLTALALAFNVAYISVFGLSKLFAGASMVIIIMAASLEFAKIVSVSYLYRYWKIISKFFRTYLTIVVVALMLLTSLGVYGYLTNAYQQTANKMEIVNSKVKIAENKKKIFQAELDRYNQQITAKNKRIDKLTEIRGKQEDRIDSLTKKRWGTRTTENFIKDANAEVQNLNAEITTIAKKVDIVNDSIGYYDQKIIELQNTDVTAEVGPLKYLSNLTGKPMDKIINWLVLLIIFVFDPLAVTLIVGANQLMVYNIKVKNGLIKDVLFGYEVEDDAEVHPGERMKNFFKKIVNFKKRKIPNETTEENLGDLNVPKNENPSDLLEQKNDISSDLFPDFKAIKEIQDIPEPIEIIDFPTYTDEYIPKEVLVVDEPLEFPVYTNEYLPTEVIELEEVKKEEVTETDLQTINEEEVHPNNVVLDVEVDGIQYSIVQDDGKVNLVEVVEEPITHEKKKAKILDWIKRNFT